MRDLFQIQRDLEDTHAALARMELAIVKEPKYPSVHATIKGLRQRQQRLEMEFLKAANERGQDVCSYRLFAGDGWPTIDALSKALASFQSLFTSVYDAIKYGPKDRARYTPTVIQTTSFRFGYTFSGSVGVVFTLPNDRMLPGWKSELDRSMTTIRQLSKADTTDKIAMFVKELGEAPIRATYKWADHHATNALGANIEWRREEEIKDEFLVQPIELERLKNTIDISGAESVEIITVHGLLVAANTVRHTFHLVTEDTDTDIRGKYKDAISEEHTVELPKSYIAKIQRTTILQFSSEQPEESYLLLELKPS
jgi:hypothetical protein